VQTTKNTLAGLAVIVLNEIYVEACGLLKIPLIEAFEKKPRLSLNTLGSKTSTSGSSVFVTV